jgi:hypothetical protein
MFEDLIEWPVVSERLRWEGKQVLRDVAGEPFLLFRLKVAGTFFPQRAAEAFIRIGRLRSRFVRIAEDGQSANGYFDEPPPEEGLVEFGYGQRVYLRCRRPFEVGSTGRLKRALLPANARNVERFGRVLEEPEPIR